MTDFGKTITPIKNCHYGNTKIYTEQNGGSLFIGGWTKGAHFDYNTHVIDLTGSEHKYYDLPVAMDSVSEGFLPFLGKSYAGWLSLPFPDMKTPSNLKTLEQWKGITAQIQGILKAGRDVVVACHGGHGRSGLFCAIVGYLLHINSDRSWSSPVEKMRMIHCYEAVETRAQEQYVYDILGLDIQIKTVYTMDTHTWKYEPCPICNTQSTFVQDIGMCLGCEKKYKELAPVKEWFSGADLKTKGEVDHACNHPNCIGIWKAAQCGHVIHDMIVVDGWCQTCYNHVAEENALELAATEDKTAPCAVCQKNSWYAHQFGVCYECSQDVVTAGQVDFVHNTITDPYRAMPHHCEDDGCVGIVVADICGHVLHNREVEDGHCPVCKSINGKQLEDM